MKILPIFSPTVRKASANLKSKLVEVTTLGLSNDRTKIVKRVDGSAYTGKIRIATDDLEELISIKNGEISTTLIRKRNGEKLFAYNKYREKDFAPLKVLEATVEDVNALKRLQKYIFSAERFRIKEKRTKKIL